MKSKELYCITPREYGNVINENAPIRRRGRLRGSWRRANDWLLIPIIIIPHGKVSKVFVGFDD
jgi:hypothetical protein